jgi:hypothetical protein
MAIRPKYDRPTSWKLRNTFLEKGYSRMQNNITQVVSNPSTSISLVSDGWSNLRNEHMVHYIIITPGQNPVLYKTVPANRVSQTAERIFHDISAVLDELGGESRVVSVVTDNCSTMQKAWGLIEENYPRIYANGCAAHVLNLLVMDICTLQEFTQTIAEVSNICKFVKTRSAVGEEVSGPGVVLIVCVRRVTQTFQFYCHCPTHFYRMRQSQTLLWDNGFQIRVYKKA